MKMKLDSQGMSSLASARRSNDRKLATLLCQPYDPANKTQEQSIKEYIANFALNAHRMYLYQGLIQGIFIWAVSCVVSTFLPVHDLLSCLLRGVMAIGFLTLTLYIEGRSKFSDQLDTMKKIYSWITIGASKSNDLDNILAQPHVQEMLKLMAPLCETETLAVWSRIVEPRTGNISSWTTTLTSGVKAVASVAGMFVNPSNTFDPAQLQKLKIDVETRAFDIPALVAVKEAVQFFASKEGRDILCENLYQPRAFVDIVTPDTITQLIPR